MVSLKMTLLVVAKVKRHWFILYVHGSRENHFLAHNVLSSRHEVHYYPIKTEQTYAFDAIKMHSIYKYIRMRITAISITLCP